MRLIIIFFIFFSCVENGKQLKDKTVENDLNIFKEENVVQKDSTVIEKANNIFKENDISKDTIIGNIVQKSDGDIIFVKFNFVDFPFYLISFTESERKFLYKKDIFSFELYANLYNDEQNSFIDIKDVQIIKGDKQYFFMYPTHSEEFPSFKIIGFSKDGSFKYYGIHTYSYNDYNKLEGVSFEEIEYQLFERSNIPIIYASKGDKKILLSHIDKNQMNENILEEERSKIEKIISTW